MCARLRVHRSAKYERRLSRSRMDPRIEMPALEDRVN